MDSIHRFFHPQSVAVVGASSHEGKVGNQVLRNILFGEYVATMREKGFQGKVFPVNPRGGEILGLEAYPSLTKIPGRVDLAVICVPAGGVMKVVEEAAAKGIRAACIISAGFSEGGHEGKERERAILEISRAKGIRIIGPNCLGVISLPVQLNATFARVMPPKGPIAFISQSGAFGTAVIEYSRQEFFGFSYFVSIGNKADVDDADLMEYFVRDSHTKCISLYMESTQDGRRLFETIKNVVPGKPVVVFKAGRTEAGVRAASSHTGALAGQDKAYDAAFRQAGAYRAKTMYDLFDASRALAYQPPVMGDGIAIVTNAGGPGVIAADWAQELSLPLARLTPKTIDAIGKFCPPTWNKGNPVDIIGDATSQRYRKVLEVVARAPEVHGIIVICGRQAMTNLMEIAGDIVEVARHTKKPILASFVGIVAQEADRWIDSQGIPVMEVPERAVRAMNALYRRGKLLRRVHVRACA